jgi:uncharacterized protein (DUF58 family)
MMFGFDKLVLPISGRNKNGTEGIKVSLHELLLEQKNAPEVFASSRKIRSNTAGTSRSPFKGRGMEFDEVREYHAGDDLRSLDWKVTARLGEPFTKLFHEERERPFFILLDMRPQMHFGTRKAFKSVIAAKITSLIMWAAKNSGDKVGGLLLSANRYVLMKPAKQRKHLISFLQSVADASAEPFAAESKKTLSEALSELRRVAHLGGVVFVISDFHDFNMEAQKQMSLLTSHNDVVCVFMTDGLEENPPPAGVYRINNGASSSMVINTADKRWAENYRKIFAKRRDAVKGFCNKTGGFFIPVRTDDDYVSLLREGIRKKRRKGYAAG